MAVVYKARQLRLNRLCATRVTTLLDEAVDTADALPELSGDEMVGGGASEGCRKQTMKMDVWMCKTVDEILKEWTLYALAYNLVRVTMGVVAGRPGVAADQVVSSMCYSGCAGPRRKRRCRN